MKALLGGRPMPAVPFAGEVIWEPSAPYNARRRHEATCWPDRSFPESWNLSAGVSDVAEGGLIAGSGGVVAARHRAPLCRIDRREVGVARRPRVHMGNLHAI